MNEEDKYAPPTFSFLAERNGKELCDFAICIDNNTKKFTFIYSTGEYFKYDRKKMYNALFYTLGEKSYYETPEKTVCIVDHELPEGSMVKMESDGVDWEAILKKKYKEFQKLTYEEKKDEIFDRLRKIQKGKIVKQAEKNMKLELKDDYAGTESRGRSFQIRENTLCDHWYRLCCCSCGRNFSGTETEKRAMIG